MRYRTCIFALCALALGCGDDRPPREPDMTAVPAADLAQLAPDMTLPPDMTAVPCTPPKTGLYNEQTSYSYVLVGSGIPPVQTGSGQFVAVRGDGTLVRPPGMLADPSKFHCTFTLNDMDKQTCLVPCCPGQMTSPMIYVSGNGWAMWLGGVCVFTTVTGSQYSATLFDVQGYFNR